LTELAQAILSQSNKMIDRQLDSMQRAAVKAQRILVWQALAVIPGTILFATIFVTLISRPIRQIRRAIWHLGEGDFLTVATVTGPRDLETLGQGLDWLRCRLFDLEQAKQKFLGQVSHELKTPLTAMREGAEL
jgi:two-component system sensor histidine kinase GlrK